MLKFFQIPDGMTAHDMPVRAMCVEGVGVEEIPGERHPGGGYLCLCRAISQ